MPPQLSFDIQVEIIKRLPVKSLIQFRSVCKTWKSLIDSSHFIVGYNFRQDQSDHLVVRYEVGDREESEVKYVSFVDDDSFPHQKFALTAPPLIQLTTTVIGSSHGLLCLTGFFGEPDVSCPTSSTKMVVLWNPAIRKSIAVAVPNVVPRKVKHVIGFGVCPITMDLKLVKITYMSSNIHCIPCQVMVFTLSSGEWITPCTNLPGKPIEFTGFQTVIGQFIYWPAYDRTDEYGESHNLVISFDLSTDEFREVDLPDSLRKSCLFISRLRGSLVLLEYDINFTTGKQVYYVWMLEHSDQKAFTKLFTIDAPNAPVLPALEFRKSGEPIIEMQNIDLTSGLVVYESCMEQINDLGICGNYHSFSVNTYTESLLLLDRDDGHIVGCGAVKR